MQAAAARIWVPASIAPRLSFAHFFGSCHRHEEKKSHVGGAAPGSATSCTVAAGQVAVGAARMVFRAVGSAAGAEGRTVVTGTGAIGAGIAIRRAGGRSSDPYARRSSDGARGAENCRKVVLGNGQA
ncbi:hypothetical protein GCM10018962_83110 [Dactylosporangium matsuzakiense]|uniref:Uncharacterized protein n=1 Tax=Dactylosporangium matsuzakiense TaxID=53360 RepID=A0A9W6KBC4_9ACTN|nr:hypothetical protein GCM10017581_001280 [Dactylosporangium matsuzakiense]